MIEAFNNIREGKPELVNDGMLLPLVRWFSGHSRNLPICVKINRLTRFVKFKILKSMLSLGVDKRIKFLRYPKSKIEENKPFNLVKGYLKQILGWSEREANFQTEDIKDILQNKARLNELAKEVGMDKKECKILNINFQSFKKPKVIKADSKNIFDF